MPGQDNDRRNQAEYVLATVLCVHEDPLSYDELREHANAVTRELNKSGIGVPLLGHQESAKQSLFRDRFESMRYHGRIGAYHPENAVKRRHDGPDEYLLTRTGFRMLSRPLVDLPGVTPEMEREIRTVVADHFETGLRGFGSPEPESLS